MDAAISKSRPRKVAQKHPQKDYNHNNILCSRSMALLENRALAEGLMPCRPAADIRGWDMVLEYNGKFHRAQVRACGYKKDKPKRDTPPKSLTFSILRTKQKKRPNESAYETSRRHFRESEIDVFIFIHVDCEMVYITPVHKMDLNRTKFTVHANGRWHDAWHVLKDERD